LELAPRLCLTDGERAWAKSFLANLTADAVQKSPVARVALHPYAAHASKAWPEEHWRALVRMLDERRIPWVLVGRGAKLFPARAEDAAGATGLRESAALLAASSVLVTGDSGPMHLAAAVGTPVVGLFGPTVRAWGFYPTGRRDTVLEADLPCRPCSLHGKKACPRAVECLASLRPETVLAELVPYLSGTGTAG
jgi:ADP-heptose:LPS heptosyltransferase